MAFGVRVTGQRLRFMSAHMATWGGRCESLHGHNYIVSVDAEGDVTADAWVIDFSILKGIIHELCESLDHKFLLQRESQVLLIAEDGDHWLVTTPESKGYAFPTSDVFALPLTNTTTEQLSWWLHGRIAAGLREAGATNIRRLLVEVEEAPGQAGRYAASIEPPRAG